jgi:hypothetical protein
MRTFAQQLVSVGFQPAFQPSPTTTRQKIAPQIASNAQVFERKSFQSVLDELFEPITKDRKVLVTRTGNGFFKARYEGKSDFAFGSNEREARHRVKMFSGGSLKERPPKEEDFKNV